LPGIPVRLPILIVVLQVCLDFVISIVPRGIRIPERRIQHVAIPIQTLRIPWTGHNRIRLDEASEGGVVVAGVVKVQAYRAVVALTGELVARRRGPGGVARFTIRMIPQLRNFATAAVGSERCRSQMIAEQVVQRVIIAHRHPLPASIVIFLRRAAIDVLVVVAHVVGGHATQHGFDAVAVAVVEEAGAGRAAYRRQAVFGILAKLTISSFFTGYYG